MKSFVVKIDDKETTLTYDSYSGACGYQYLTPGNKSSHAFSWPLSIMVGSVFRTSGHKYHIIRELKSIQE